MSKKRRRKRGVSNAEMKGYLKIMAMTNSAMINNTESMIRGLIKQFNVPYPRAEQIATNFRRDSRIAR